MAIDFFLALTLTLQRFETRKYDINHKVLQAISFSNVMIREIIAKVLRHDLFPQIA